MNVDSVVKNTDGKWFDIDDAKYKIRSNEHPIYEAELEKIISELSDMEEGKEKEKLLIAEISARCALVDWKGVDSAKKKGIKFDVEIARIALFNHRSVAIRIFNIARNDVNYREIVEAKAKK